MSKTIVFCADGTWNGPDEEADGHAPDAASGLQPGLTNVCKAFAWLKGDIQPNDKWGGVEMEKILADTHGAPVQVAKYLRDKVKSGVWAVDSGRRQAASFC